MARLQATAESHPKWPIRQVTRSGLGLPEKQMLIVLMGKELGFMRPDSTVFTGDGLARCSSLEFRHLPGSGQPGLKLEKAFASSFA